MGQIILTVGVLSTVIMEYMGLFVMMSGHYRMLMWLVDSWVLREQEELMVQLILDLAKAPFGWTTYSAMIVSLD